MKLASGVTVSAAVTTVVRPAPRSWFARVCQLLIAECATDRPLTHINKKGRPVSQCPHCRGLRKSRTTHVRCGCGDMKKNGRRHDLDANAVGKRNSKREHVDNITLIRFF